MTKYREILRLASLDLTQQSIADSCNVSKKTVNRVLKRANELNVPGRLVKTKPMLCWQKSYSHLPRAKPSQKRRCRTLLIYTKSCSITE